MTSFVGGECHSGTGGNSSLFIPSFNTCPALCIEKLTTAGEGDMARRNCPRKTEKQAKRPDPDSTVVVSVRRQLLPFFACNGVFVPFLFGRSCPHFPRIQPCYALVWSPSWSISVLHLCKRAENFVGTRSINPHFSRFAGVPLRLSLHFPRTPYLNVH